MNKLNLLIVDDREENIAALEAVLNREDINILKATSPDKALCICEENDIAIAIIAMQINGFELIKSLEKNSEKQETKIIFVIPISSEAKYTIKDTNLGVIDYLYEPLDPHITVVKVDSFIQLAHNQKELEFKNEQLNKIKTELIKAKEEAQLGKKAKENFIANISHEIRTPINGIIGLAHLLKKSSLNEAQKEMLNLLEVSSNSLLGVVNDILDITKIETGKLMFNNAEINILDLCKQVTNLLNIKAKEKNIALKLDIDKNLPRTVIADSLRLNQIFMNLLSNAIKFTNNGEVIFKAEVLDKRSNTALIKFSVIDTGIGISSENLKTIFESFERVEENQPAIYGGTGLGLTIAKRLAELKGGSLDVISELGKGSTFSFTKWYKCVDKKQMEDIHIDEDAELSSMKGLKVLVAEDSPINIFLIVKILKDWEAEVTVVENGKEALDTLANKDFDIILMDTYMPVMNGLDAIEKIRKGVVKGKESTPIISFSAGVLESDKAMALQVGANDIIGKPFKVSALHHKIKMLTTAKTLAQ